jgi:hypothetical protein
MGKNVTRRGPPPEIISVVRMIAGLVLILVLTACSGNRQHRGLSTINPSAITTLVGALSAAPSRVTSATAQGTITGQLSYPSSALPPDLEVCAANRVTQEEQCTTDRSFDSASKQFAYRMELPIGQYLVYGRTMGRRAYYSQYVVCGLRPDCPSHDPLVVPVESGQTTEGVDPGDWYVP